MTRPTVGSGSLLVLKLVIYLNGISRTTCQEDQPCSTATQLGNAMGADCVFPFLYESSSHTSCTNASHTRPWCATTANYDVDSKWGNCIYDCEPPQCPYLTTTGDRCVFPFIYNGSPYYDCINEPNGTHYPWCSLTDNWDRDQQQADCIIMSSRNVPCIFPFQYQGETYYQCTRTTGPPWCGLTVIVHDNTADWAYCDETIGCDENCLGGNCGRMSTTYPTRGTDCSGGACAITASDRTTMAQDSGTDSHFYPASSPETNSANSPGSTPSSAIDHFPESSPDATTVSGIDTTPGSADFGSNCANDGCETAPLEEKKALPIVEIVVPVVIIIIVIIAVIAGLVWYRQRKENDNIPSFFYESQSAHMRPTEEMAVNQTIRDPGYNYDNVKASSSENAFVNSAFH